MTEQGHWPSFLPGEDCRLLSAIGRYLGWAVLLCRAVGWALWLDSLGGRITLRLLHYATSEAILSSWAGLLAWCLVLPPQGHRTGPAAHHKDVLSMDSWWFVL